MSSDSFDSLSKTILEVTAYYEKRFKLMFQKLELPYEPFSFYLGYRFTEAIPDSLLEDDGKPVRSPRHTVAVDSMEGFSQMLLDFMNETENKFKVTFDALDLTYEPPPDSNIGAMSLPILNPNRLDSFIDSKGPDCGSKSHRDIHYLNNLQTRISMMRNLSLTSPVKEGSSSPFSDRSSPGSEDSPSKHKKLSRK